MKIDPQDIKVKIKLLKDSGNILAQASITLFDCWTEHGWRIMKSKHLNSLFEEYIWIQSPSFKVGTVWKEIIFIDDLKLYDKLQEKIHDSYLLEKRKHPTDVAPAGTNTDLSNDISDEVPF
jgi:DNA-binding cell septation regulator SpoVG